MTHHRTNLNRAFTTVELLVSTAIMTVALIGVVSIFNISSSAASRTNAHAEMLEASASLQNELSHHLSQMAPGLLIIESPPATTVRSDIPGGPGVRRLRHDRLVFISTAASEEFQSSIDPRRGRPDDPLGTTDNRLRPAATSREALLYFGPGIPVTFESDGTPIPRNIDFLGGTFPDVTLAASEWMFLHRQILLLNETSTPGWAPAPPDVTVFTSPGGMLDYAPLDPQFRESRMDTVINAPTGERATASTLIDMVRTRSIIGRDADPTPAQIHALWQPNWAILRPRLEIPAMPMNPPDPLPPDYYTRTGSNFIPRLADFRIEWTDGKRIDPYGADGDATTLNDNDHRTRWFGLAPDPNTDPPFAPDPTDPVSINLMRYRARMRAIAGLDSAGKPNPSNPSTNNPDNTTEETAAFANIEWSPFGIDADQVAQYRAVWRAGNWQYRPKALRFTYRLYDAGRRLYQTTTTDLNENGLPDPDLAPVTDKPSVIQHGIEFSIVVPIP